MIRFITPLPPSSNHLYFNLKKGGRALTKEGSKFINEVKVGLVRAYPNARAGKNDPLVLALRLYFPDVVNTGWPKKTDTKYKRRDVSNYVKALEDALKQGLGVDDSNHITMILDKQEGPPRAVIWIWNLAWEESPFDAVLYSLDPDHPWTIP